MNKTNIEFSFITSFNFFLKIIYMFKDSNINFSRNYVIEIREYVFLSGFENNRLILNENTFTFSALYKKMQIFQLVGSGLNLNLIRNYFYISGHSTVTLNDFIYFENENGLLNIDANFFSPKFLIDNLLKLNCNMIKVTISNTETFNLKAKTILSIFVKEYTDRRTMTFFQIKNCKFVLRSDDLDLFILKSYFNLELINVNVEIQKNLDSSFIVDEAFFFDGMNLEKKSTISLFNCFFLQKNSSYAKNDVFIDIKPVFLCGGFYSILTVVNVKVILGNTHIITFLQINAPSLMQISDCSFFSNNLNKLSDKSSLFLLDYLVSSQSDTKKLNVFNNLCKFNRGASGTFLRVEFDSTNQNFEEIASSGFEITLEKNQFIGNQAKFRASILNIQNKNEKILQIIASVFLEVKSR